MHNEMVQEALDLFEATRANYLSVARSTAEQMSKLTGKPITVDDVRKACPLPDGVDARVLGGVFRAKCWVKVGHTYSKRDECHRSNRMIQYVFDNQMAEQIKLRE